jgi:hypothetical protein
MRGDGWDDAFARKGIAADGGGLRLPGGWPELAARPEGSQLAAHAVNPADHGRSSSRRRPLNQGLPKLVL